MTNGSSGKNSYRVFSKHYAQIAIDGHVLTTKEVTGRSPEWSDCFDM
jgi:hypothetical protein